MQPNNALIVAFLMIASGAAGYLIDRWIRRSGAAETTESVIKTVELKRMLEAEGLSFEQAKLLRDRLYSGKEPITPAIAQAIVERRPLEDAVPDDTVDFGNTTVGMKLGMGNRLDELKGQIEYVLSDLLHQASPARQEAMREAHAAWEKFIELDGDVAGLLWEGGSGAGLLNLSRQVELAEMRLNELRLMKAEEDAL